MAMLKIPDDTLARLQAAAAARHVSVETYLNAVAAADAADDRASFSNAPVQFRKRGITERTMAVNSIRKLATEIKGKSSIEELIADKHADALRAER